MNESSEEEFFPVVSSGPPSKIEEKNEEEYLSYEYESLDSAALAIQKQNRSTSFHKPIDTRPLHSEKGVILSSIRPGDSHYDYLSSFPRTFRPFDNAGDNAKNVGLNQKMLKQHVQMIPLSAINKILPNSQVRLTDGKKEQVVLPITDKSYEQIRTLDQILPPIVTRVNSSSGASNEGSPVSDYVAIVSRKLPRRQEMGELIETLNAQLEQRAARNEGFCPTRRQIFDDLFDEILRQVALDCPERGFLLWRVREEAFNTINILHNSLSAAEYLGEERVQKMMANCKEWEQQSLSLEADIRNLQMGKRFLEQRFENVYESSKMQRDYLKKKFYETEQSAFKLFNSQHNIYKNHLEEYLHTKKGKSRLRDLIEDEDAEEKTTAT